MSEPTLEQARAAKERAKKLFAEKAAVVGVGIRRVGEGFGLKVNLSTPAPPDADLPDSIDGVPVLTEVVGSLKTFRPENQESALSQGLH